MLKDTKSLGNNKAPACESRGFVRKRKKGCILTHLLLSIKDCMCVRVIGLEPTRLTAPDPKSGAAANYATPARDFPVKRCKDKKFSWFYK